MTALVPILMMFAAQCCCIQGLENWPHKYFIIGEKIDLIGHKLIPFKMWFDSEILKMRFEAYNGLMEQYIFEVKSDFNTSKYKYFQKHYKADKEGNAEWACSEIEKNDTVTIILSLPASVRLPPDIKKFNLTGKEKQTQVWTNVQEFEDNSYNWRIEETMNVYGKTPVRLKHRYFNTNTGQLVENYIVKYFYYTGNVKEDDFKVTNTDCQPLIAREDGINFEKSLELQNSHFAFDRFKNHHNRKYSKEEHALRKRIFKQNWRVVKEHNSKNLSYTLTLNKFADRTPEEMRRVNGIRPHTPLPGTLAFPYTEAELEKMAKELPEEFDWRLQEAVSGVKDQGYCGSCWAFAATAAIESALLIKRKINFDLSEQSIVDCAWGYNASGCFGGFTESALQYVQKHGIPTESDYGEYLEVNGKCHIKNVTRKIYIQDYVEVPPMSVDALKVVVYMYGPVAASIYFSNKMAMYSSGIFFEYPEESKYHKVNHAVLVVGFGTRNGAPYWVAKDSHGKDWGMDGYILISAAPNVRPLEATYFPLI